MPADIFTIRYIFQHGQTPNNTATRFKTVQFSNKREQLDYLREVPNLGERVCMEYYLWNIFPGTVALIS